MHVATDLRTGFSVILKTCGATAGKRVLPRQTLGETAHPHLLHRFGFKEGANLPLFVGFCSSVNGHLYFEGIGGSNVGLTTLHLWLLFPDIWMGTLFTTEPMHEVAI